MVCKKNSIRWQIWRSQIRYIVFQDKLLFNLVKDLFKWNESLGRSVTVHLQSENEKVFDLGGIPKKYSLRCQISRSKTRYIVFQPKLLFHLVNDLFKRIDDLGRNLVVQVPFEGGKFWHRCYAKKVLYTLSNFALKKSLSSVSTYTAFQSSQGLIQMNWWCREECQCPVSVQGG